MNRQQRRSAARANKKVKPRSRQTGLVLLTVAGLAGSSLGLVSTANAEALSLTANSCETINTELALLAANTDGGTINMNWSGTCLLTQSYELLGRSTIIGPTSGGRLTLQVLDGSQYGIKSTKELNISHIDFTGGTSGDPIYSILYIMDTTLPWNTPIATITDVNFRDANLTGSAITLERYTDSEEPLDFTGEISVIDSSFTNLSSTESGAALYSRGLTVISNSTFTDNSASFGGAIFVYDGGLSISGSTFSSNTATYDGGAIWSSGSGSIMALASSFDLNSAANNGGAIFSEGGLLTVQDSTFDTNSVGDSGGAIHGYAQIIENSTFHGNTAALGAAAVFIGEGLLISNSTFWNNPASDLSDGSISGGGISFFGNIFANSLANTNDKVIGPPDPDRYANVDLGANLFTDSSFVFEVPTTGEGASKLVAFDDLKLTTLSLNQTSPVNTGPTKTVALGAGSIARNYYSDTSPGALEGITRNNLAATDQRGVSRPNGARYDVGAYESGEVPNPPAVTPETPALVAATIANQKIKFAPGSSKLTAASKKKLRVLATEIQTKGLRTVNLEGYTATLTKAAPNGRVFRVKLSKARTNAVEKYLKEQLKKSGYSVTFTKSPKGAANPVKSNKTEKGRKDNRRVEIVVD
jgi:predicted outer membrane repeat protein